MHVERWQCIILVAGGVLPIERSGCLLCLEADLEPRTPNSTSLSNVPALSEVEHPSITAKQQVPSTPTRNLNCKQ
ncbi:unnamed protein product [Ceratitis capitata]|uniref:(Mediterranean fruit fly) hypothetical protein n=1 Tax=Ceratitis capitata TaxID=7213 RepID=A0A811UHL9_CERCA|nr:unnamed protein product [Ceratitis capitata]